MRVPFSARQDTVSLSDGCCDAWYMVCVCVRVHFKVPVHLMSASIQAACCILVTPASVGCA